jgi:hypothetical protein
VAGLGVLAAGGGAGGGSDQGLPGRVVNGLPGLDWCGIIESGLGNLSRNANGEQRVLCFHNYSFITLWANVPTVSPLFLRFPRPLERATVGIFVAQRKGVSEKWLR